MNKSYTKKLAKAHLNRQKFVAPYQMLAKKKPLVILQNLHKMEFY